MISKVLVLTSGDIYERRGFFNAVISRTKHLMEAGGFDVDVLLLSTYEPWLVRRLRHTRKHARPAECKIDGVHIKIDWCRFSLFDYILNVKLHKGLLFKELHNRGIISRLQGYDFIIAHSKECGLLAMKAKQMYGTPYSVTWHGSDIHTVPFNNPSAFGPTKSIIEDADINFFVSKALLKTSERITAKGNKQLLYNGYNPAFKVYSAEHRHALRQKLGCENKKVVFFAGGFLAIKNILVIPAIFQAIYLECQDVVFWMIGDGKYRSQAEALSKDLPVVFWGNQEPEAMPDFMNAADVFILPSINEGLPLSVVEALACGCNVVGSMVGGIPEVIGDNNCVDLKDPHFARSFAQKVLSYLQAPDPIVQPLASDFDWKRTALRELEFMKNIHSCNS